MKTSLFAFALLLAIPCGWLMADVKSTSGTNINFDLNNDGSIEMRLNTTGLGIGTEPSGNLHVSGNIAASEEVFLGAASGNSSLQINGALEFYPQSVSANTTLEGNTLIFANTASDNITLTLPYAGNVLGRTYWVKKTSNSNYLKLTSDNTIDDLKGVELGAANTGMPSIEVMSDGSVWHIMKYTGNIGPYGLEDLILWLKLDEKSGATAYDSGPHGQHGRLASSNGLMFTSDAIAGVIDGALDFDGSNDDIDNTGGVQGTDDFSFGAWISADTTHGVDSEATSGTGGTSGQTYPIYPPQSGASSGVGISVGTNGISVYEHGSGFMPPPAVYGVSIGTGWNHIYVTVSSGTSTIWLNGIDVHVGQDTGRTTKSPYQIGGGEQGHFNGQIDDVRVYNKTLSAKDILTLYNGGVNNSSDNLVGHWTLDETSGTTADDSSSASNDGTLNSLTFAGNTTTGQISNALSFDGSDDYIDLSSHIGDYSGLNHGTISAWVKTVDAAERKPIVTLNDANAGDSDRIVFEVLDGGQLQLIVRDGGSNQVQLESTTTVNDGNWHHVVAWSSGSQARLYIDGQRVTAFDTDTNNSNWFNDVSGLDAMYIGYDNWGNSPDLWFIGQIDDVRIYNRPLSSWEIEELYKAGL